MNNTFWNKIYLSLVLALFPLIFASCDGEVKKEDIVKKRDKVKEHINNTKEEIEEALSLKEKYLEQQKDNMLSQLQERQLQVEMEIEKLEDMVKDSKSIADSEINAAIKKYQAELERIDNKRDRIRNTAKEDWKARSTIFKKQIDEYKQNLEDFLVEIEELEAIKSDSL